MPKGVCHLFRQVSKVKSFFSRGKKSKPGIFQLYVFDFRDQIFILINYFTNIQGYVLMGKFNFDRWVSYVKWISFLTELILVLG